MLDQWRCVERGMKGSPLLCCTGLGGSESVRLCPGGGGGALFLDRVPLPPADGWEPRGREVGGPEEVPRG